MAQCPREGGLSLLKGWRVFGKGLDGEPELCVVVGEEQVVAEVGRNNGGLHFRGVAQESFLRCFPFPCIAASDEVSVAFLDPVRSAMEAPCSHQAFVVDVGEFVRNKIGQGAFIGDRLSVVSYELVACDVTAAEETVR